MTDAWQPVTVTVTVTVTVIVIVIVIVMRNSIAFIESIFAGYRDGEIMVPSRPAADGRKHPRVRIPPYHRT